MRSQLHLVIVGAAGMVGRLALHCALEHPAVARLTVVGHTKLRLPHPKLREIVHEDFGNCSALAEVLTGQNAVIFCTDGCFRSHLPGVRVAHVTEFGRVLLENSPEAAFSLLSNADDSAQSRYLRGGYRNHELEQVVLGMGFPRVYVFRAGYVCARPPGQSNFVCLWQKLCPLLSSWAIRSEDLANAMVDATIRGTGVRESLVFRNRDIRAIAASL